MHNCIFSFSRIRNLISIHEPSPAFSLLYNIRTYDCYLKFNCHENEINFMLREGFSTISRFMSFVKYALCNFQTPPLLYFFWGGGGGGGGGKPVLCVAGSLFQAAH